MPVLKWLKIDFIPKDVQEFFTNVSNKALDARKESGEVTIWIFKCVDNCHIEFSNLNDFSFVSFSVS